MFETGTATDYLDLLEKLNTFLKTNGSAFGLVYAGTGNGTLTGYKGGSASVAETFTITATSATNFTVVGSVSGSLAAATVGTPYTGTKVQFLLTAGGTAFIAGDVFTLSTAPKWTELRRARGCTVVASSGGSGQNAAENLVDGKTALDSTRSWTPIVDDCNAEFTLQTAETIVEYALLADGTFGPKTWTLEYWNGSTWVTLDTQTNFAGFGGAGVGSLQAFTIASPVSASRYRIHPTAWNGGTRHLHAVQLRRTASGFDAAFGQYLWKAPGNDGTSDINVGIHHFRRLDADYFNWELAAFDGHNAASSFYAQPGAQANLYLTLHNTSIPYWFVCDGRRVVVVAKIGSQYEPAFLGLLEPYFTPGQVPLPMALGGTLAIETKPTWDQAAWRHSNTTNAHRAPTHSDPNVGSFSRALAAYQLRARKPDGSWAGFNASWNDSFTALFAPDHWIWPYAGDFNLLDVNLDGGYALWPVMLMHATPNVLGQLAGISAVTGQGLTAESTVRVGQVDHLTVPNITRTDRNDWLAVRLD